MTTSGNQNQPPEQTKHEPRQKIGEIDGHSGTLDLNKLTPQQLELRNVIISEFKAKKVKKFAATQVKHINSGRQLGEAIRFLFDDKGRPPANAPLDDIIEERKRIEYEIRWLDAVTVELRNTLGKLIELENDALDLLRQNQDPG